MCRFYTNQAAVDTHPYGLGRVTRYLDKRRSCCIVSSGLVCYELGPLIAGMRSERTQLASKASN